MIEKIVILSLVSIGISYTTWDDQIFERPAEWVKDKIGEFWAKPLFACYVCCTFWYSLIICLCVGWPWYLSFPAMGLSAVISLLQND